MSDGDASLSHEVPLVLQDPLSIIAVGSSTQPTALRAVLESFNYLTEIHWVGSRKQLLEILRGNIPTHKYVVLDCHGDPEGLVVPEEPMVTPAELAEVVNLPERVLVSLTCYGGLEPFAEAFLGGGCEAYVAPVDSVKANSVVLFAIQLFYLLSIGHRLPLAEAVARARAFDTDCDLFRLYTKFPGKGNRYGHAGTGREAI